MELLGSGVSSEVYKVRLDRDSVLYALKKSKDAMRSARERLALETCLVTRLTLCLSTTGLCFE